METILIIEDDKDLQEGLLFTLRAEGYEAECAGTMRDGLERIKDNCPGLVLLDCNLPDGNGFELCQQVRQFSDIPILMLTARDSEIDEVKALELGVDDYMSKPFSVAVLKARIKKLITKSRRPQLIETPALRIDTGLCKVYKKGEEIPLSKMEYKLLLYLIENKNQVLLKEQILSKIWDSNGKFVDENIVSVNIRRLREKIEEEPGNPRYIKTVYGMGYLWREEK